MGSWGIRPFENDEALGFLSEVRTRRGVLKLLGSVADTPLDAYVDIDDGHAVIAACEWIVWSGEGAGRITERDWPIRHRLRVDPQLAQLALRALLRTMTRGASETVQGSDSLRLRVLEQLHARLCAAAGRLGGALPWEAFVDRWLPRRGKSVAPGKEAIALLEGLSPSLRNDVVVRLKRLRGTNVTPPGGRGTNRSLRPSCTTGARRSTSSL